MCYLVEKSAKYLRENQGASEHVPFVLCGDFNSFPVSSVLSAIYAEDIEGKDRSNDTGSTWVIPEDADQDVQKFYKQVN